MPADAAMGATIVSTSPLTIDGSQLQQTGQIHPDTFASGCSGRLKFEPTLEDSILRRYRIHTFTSRVTNPVCVTISFPSLTPACTIFSAAYGTFNPANVLESYAADLGSPTSTTGSYAFNAAAGNPSPWWFTNRPPTRGARATH